MIDVKLRTGVEHSRALVAVVRMCCVELLELQPVALYEAVMMARDRDHVPFGNAGDILKSTALVDDTGRMDGCTCEIIDAMFDRYGRMLPPSEFLG